MKTDTLGVLMAPRYPRRVGDHPQVVGEGPALGLPRVAVAARKMTDGWMVATTSSARSDSMGRPRWRVSRKLSPSSALPRSRRAAAARSA